VIPELAPDERAFPPAPPFDLDDPLVLIEHDWEAFAALSRMTDHWARPGWSSGRRAYYWMLTFSDAPDLNRRARHCQRALAHLGMDPVPGNGLHVTMTRIGHTEHVRPRQIEQLVTLAERLHLAPFQVLAHPLAGSTGAVRFTLSPWTPLIRLHAELSTIGRQSSVPGGAPTTAFRPHLGIQYSNRDRPAGPVIESVARLRPLQPVPIEVTAVDLVELRRTDRPQRAYCWDVLHRITLGSASPRG
jgi:2'-5' RNA ligase